MNKTLEQYLEEKKESPVKEAIVRKIADLAMSEARQEMASMAREIIESRTKEMKAEVEKLLEKKAQEVLEKSRKNAESIYTPKKGKDYFDGKDGEKGEKGDKGDIPTRKELVSLIKPLIPKAKDGRDGYTPIKGIDYFDGKDGTTLSGEEIINKINEAKTGKIDADKLDLPTPKFGRQISGSGTSIVFNETPSGDVNGSNTIFTLANLPKTGSVMFFVNGQYLTGGGEDYSISGKTITLLVAPPTGSVIRATYAK